MKITNKESDYVGKKFDVRLDSDNYNDNVNRSYTSGEVGTLYSWIENLRFWNKK